MLVLPNNPPTHTGETSISPIWHIELGNQVWMPFSAASNVETLTPTGLRLRVVQNIEKLFPKSDPSL